MNDNEILKAALDDAVDCLSRGIMFRNSPEEPMNKAELKDYFVKCAIEKGYQKSESKTVPDFAVKTAPRFMKDVILGDKCFTVRKFDRPWEVGKIVRAMPIDDSDVAVDVKITYVLTWEDFPDGIKDGYCVCGFERLGIVLLSSGGKR